MIRNAFLAASAAMALAACNQSAPTEEANAPTPATAEQPAAIAQARVNMAPVDPAKAKAVMHERHEGMEKVGKTMKSLARAVKADPLDMAAIKANAATMDGLAQKSANWFPAGTGPETGKTGAKPAIWENPKDFAAKVAAWQSAAGKFHKAAASGDAAATKAAFGDLGKSCKSCHDDYRKEMKH